MISCTISQHPGLSLWGPCMMEPATDPGPCLYIWVCVPLFVFHCFYSLYWWLSARLQYLHCYRTGDTAVLHLPIDLWVKKIRHEIPSCFNFKILADNRWQKYIVDVGFIDYTLTHASFHLHDLGCSRHTNYLSDMLGPQMWLHFLILSLFPKSTQCLSDRACIRMRWWQGF